MEARDLRPYLGVAGTGRMGREIGRFFLRRGWEVTWISRDRGRLEEFSRRTVRALGAVAAAGARFEGYDAPRALAADVLVETVEESAAAKREVFDRLAPRLPAGALLLSNSSSLLPGEIHPRCLGAHFFAPVETSGVVETIVPAGAPPEAAARLRRLVESVGLRPLPQNERRAFAANRLLLPLQNECFRALRGGWPPPIVDRASASPLFPAGQLALMDAVGLDVVHPAVCNYRRRMPEEEARAFAPLADGLGELVARGKRGRKNRDGLLVGAPLPWGAGGTPPREAGALARDLQAVALNSCALAVARGDLDREELDAVLAGIHGAAETPSEATRRFGPEALRVRLLDLHAASGAFYLRPAVERVATGTAP